MTICDDECFQDIKNYSLITASSLSFLAFTIAIYQIVQHLKHYTNSHLQQKIIQIITMVPFYSLMSFLSILVLEGSEIFSAVRDLYEALFIYNFFNLLICYICFEPENQIVEQKVHDYLIEKYQIVHIFPFNWILKPYRISNLTQSTIFFTNVKYRILQYLFFKPLATIGEICIVSTLEGNTKLFWVYFCRFLSIISVSLCLYFLIIFYQALRKPLKPFNPLLKFLSVKVTLFFTFWQNIVIQSFRSQILSVFKTREDSEIVMKILENLLICFEMVILAFVTSFAFSYKDFKSTLRSTLAFKLLKDVYASSFLQTVKDMSTLVPKRTQKFNAEFKVTHTGQFDRDKFYQSDTEAINSGSNSFIGDSLSDQEDSMYSESYVSYKIKLFADIVVEDHKNLKYNKIHCTSKQTTKKK